MKPLSIIVFALFLLFQKQASAQDNFWVGLEQALDVRPYAGKNFRFSAAMKTDGSPALLALLSALVEKEGGQWGFFEHMGNRPVYSSLWNTYSIEGKIDSGALALKLGITCMGNGTCFYDAVQVQVETAAGVWQTLPLVNGTFNQQKTATKAPEGWTIAQPSPYYAFGGAAEDPFEGSGALSITGIGVEDDGSIAAMKTMAYVRQHYTKTEHSVPMRDGTKLFTAVYTPKNASEASRYPVMLHRTPYSVGPYGTDQYSFYVAPNETMLKEGYIFVHQDVRGRYMSEGVWTNMTPHINNKKSTTDVDESTDTWDTIDWLLKNISFHNGKVGQWGISYPGFYATAGSIDAHPALKAVSPQAPVADLFFDDFHHNGAFTQAYFWNLPLFGTYKNKPVKEQWFQYFERGTPDSYDFYRRNGTLKQLGEKYYRTNFLWNEMVAHPNYDTFWKSRRIVDHLTNLKPAYLIVGGWFDAEDLYGPLVTYKTIEKNNPSVYNTLVMGPFGHGDWAREKGAHKHHQLYFGDSISTFFQRTIEAPFFRHFLKGDADGRTGLPEAYLYNTGTKEWKQYERWPLKTTEKKNLFFHKGGKLSFSAPKDPSYSEYISNPDKPVPYTMDVQGSFNITPRNYMSEDQRFAASRPDVLVFETEPLTEDITLGGEVMAHLKVSSTGTDADWVVKLIDVYPGNEPNTPHTPKGVTLAGYQQMVRSEVMRSRYREGFEKAVPLTPGKVTAITFPLQDVLHTFKKGHRIMIQVQSSWYPLIDLNPQTFVPNIYKAEKKDFTKAVHRVHHSVTAPSYIAVEVVKD